MEHVDVMLAAAVMREVSIEGLILLVFNVLMAIAFCVGAFGVRRLVRQNDQEHRDLSERSDRQDEKIERSLEKLIATVEAEREARHQLAQTTGERDWQLNADLKANYQTRREGLRLYGSLVQKLDAVTDEIKTMLRELPCNTPRCPSENGGETND